MNDKLCILSIIGTRPEIIRLSEIFKKLDIYCNHIIVHTGQNYDYTLNEIFFNDLGVRKPDYFLNSAGKNAAITIGNIIIKIDKLLFKINPDAILVLGDTNSCLAVLSAKRKKIPIFHIEAGNRCFDQRVPEEINRKIIDHIADINLTYSDIAREYLLAEGFNPDRIIKIGSPMYEVIHKHINKINSSNILNRIKLKAGKYFIISAHREENVENANNIKKLADILNKIAEKYDFPIIVSTHPRTRKCVEKNNLIFHSNIQLIKPLGFTDYVKLQIESKAVLSDSGTLIEESSILNFPALNIRETHERPEGMEEASVIMTGLSTKRIIQALSILENQPTGKHRLLKLVNDYFIPNVSDKVIRIIFSYIDYVNRIIWKKY
ncbi:UDP-2,3-diacetamido-2,3-dideoxy-D-glucuronate 2-epimerase [Candidatus Arsenophonus lipoptenae]|uniref:UDP-2,3-diacetamido-2,3-dideoxy-D-glucuronate 2-epimerase n=1 Tax=Candidatus Arsenophonus lipoptenae TaxID=634113 RepID=A0A120HPT4_9GAMM|nr:UDP-N-acetylglucosamine 2-epimerase (non-hydrolyzing) [Candidatus Arsenophonus lipoptenae]AMA64738.1 UDP-2,3-diacetamido-2,3-dideoxy-D-glucuronate 2-epimerase [Candidatus Arsenophonus lipoptenae]